MEKSDLNCFFFLMRYTLLTNCVGRILSEKVYFLFEKQALIGLLKDSSIENISFYAFFNMKNCIT